MVFLLQSEDLKKQSDRIIQEVKANNDTSKFAEEIIAKTNTPEFVKMAEDFRRELLRTIEDLKQSVLILNDKIDSMNGKPSFMSRAFNEEEAGSLVK